MRIEHFVFPLPTMHIQLYNVANDAAYIYLLLLSLMMRNITNFSEATP